MATAFDKGLVDAAKRGDTVGVMKALRGGVDADSLPSQWSSESDMRALHYAAYSNAADVAKLLLDAGADANRKQGDCYTPLHYAAFFKHHDVARALIVAGADPNMPDDAGRTPITHARDKKDSTMLAILLPGEDHPTALAS